jgi:hypothetical protein
MRLILSLVFTVVIFGIAEAAPSKAQPPPLKIFWEGGSITFQHPKMFLLHGPTDVPMWVNPANSAQKPPLVDCAFLDMKAKCWRTKPAKKDDVYGVGLKFKNPIAVLPEHSLKSEAEESEADDWGERAKNAGYLARRPPFTLEVLSEASIAAVTEVHSTLGNAGESHAFSPVDETVGGDYALNLWRTLVGKAPTRNCFTESDFCSVVVRAEHGDREAIAYCAIMNTEIGLGLPFNCSVVAFNGGAKWFVFSYDSPEQCDGCGAGSGVSCSVKGDDTIDQIASLLISAVKAGRTNLELKPIKRTSDGLTLLGKNTATNSRFVSGYYDKSYASYTVSKGADGIEVSGLFNLLISAEPSPNGVDYRDIGKGASGQSDLDWFQAQVIDILKKGLSENGKRQVECEVNGTF